MKKITFLLLCFPLCAFASAVDASSVVDLVIANIAAVVAVGLSCLSVLYVVQSFRALRELLGHGNGATDTRTFEEKYAAGDAVSGVDFVDVIPPSNDRFTNANPSDDGFEDFDPSNYKPPESNYDFSQDNVSDSARSSSGASDLGVKVGGGWK